MTDREEPARETAKEEDESGDQDVGIGTRDHAPAVHVISLIFAMDDECRVAPLINIRSAST